VSVGKRHLLQASNRGCTLNASAKTNSHDGRATLNQPIRDTAGQERYHSLAPMYYRGAAAAIIVYDITSTDSFNRAKAWVRELQRQGSPNMIMALAGEDC